MSYLFVWCLPEEETKPYHFFHVLANRSRTVPEPFRVGVKKIEM